MPRARRNLVHDTVFRRWRRRASTAVHAADDALNRVRGGPIRVLFEAASPMSVSVFRPVFARLSQDTRLEFWFTTCDASWHGPAIFGPLGLTDRLVASDAARWMKFDAYINADFWDMTWLRRRARLMHFFHGVAGKYGLDAPTRIAPLVSAFDRLMFPNVDRRRRYAEAGLVDELSPQAALIGYPKVDCLVDGSLDRAVIARALRLEAGRPTVLYAPTWSPYSSLNRFGKQILNTLSHMDANVIVKLHDRSYDGTARGSGGIDWRRELRPFCIERGVHLASEADASPYLFVADALVTDHSSVAFEFMLLDRPIVVVDCPELITRARINPDKVATLRQAADVVEDPRALRGVLQAALARPQDHSGPRRSTAEALFYGAGGATSRAVECFYDMLAIEAPTVDGAKAPAALARGFSPANARTT